MRGRFTPKGMTDVSEMEERGVSSTVDLRSDTVTRPSAEMRRAMAAAEVGDDVYGEDPTVNRLEQRAAEILAREAALFVPTGTMGNQIAIHLHAHSGQEVICEARSHVFNYEMGMAAAFSGCLIRPVESEDGLLDWRRVEAQLSLTAPYHRARTGLAVLENTHNLAGGVVLSVERTAELCRCFHERGIPVHLDGARIFNAAAALGVAARELAKDCDSVMFCLSKGLGAPVGSLLAGSRDFIHRARIVRKMLGGGMRQAGVLAAAGLVALEKGPARLAEDHALARRLAEGLAEIRGVTMDPAKVRTNIVIFGTSRTGFTAAEIVARMAEHNVLAGTVGGDAIRLVTHCDVDAAKIEEALHVIRAAIERA